MCVRIYTRVAAYAHVRKTARLDCENYVGKTAIRCRCNNLSWTASRVGGNYAELMRSSSCASRIIYSESASLSPCITQSGFSAAAPPTSASLPPGIHGIRPDKIKFSDFTKTFAVIWEISYARKPRRDNTPRFESKTRELLHDIDQRSHHCNIARNVNRSQCIKEFED